MKQSLAAPSQNLYLAQLRFASLHPNTNLRALQPSNFNPHPLHLETNPYPSFLFFTVQLLKANGNLTSFKQSKYLGSLRDPN